MLLSIPQLHLSPGFAWNASPRLFGISFAFFELKESRTDGPGGGTWRAHGEATPAGLCLQLCSLKQGFWKSSLRRGSRWSYSEREVFCVLYVSVIGLLWEPWRSAVICTERLQLVQIYLYFSTENSKLILFILLHFAVVPQTTFKKNVLFSVS